MDATASSNVGLVVYDGDNTDERASLTAAAAVLKSFGVSLCVPVGSLPSRPNQISRFKDATAQFVPAHSAEDEEATRVLRKEEKRNSRIAAKRSFADSAKGTPEDRKRVALALLSTPLSEQSREDIRILASHGAKALTMTVAGAVVPRSCAVSFPSITVSCDSDLSIKP